MKSYFRPEIDAMAGYVPGEQPKLPNLVKLNTNENPYPPSPQVQEVIANFNYSALRRYPDPAADSLRDEIASQLGVTRNQIIMGNGSDDILTMVFRAFTAPDRPLACLDPTYSLYIELAKIQNAPVIRIGLDPNDFSMPKNLLEQAAKANLLIITRPNAPTGNSFPREQMRDLCKNFDGIVLFDEAYVDFAEDNCLEFATLFDNTIVTRTFSKSYSLAGLRLGYAVGNPELIKGLFKIKDSYNLDSLTQLIGRAAFADRNYHQKCCEQIKTIRTWLEAELIKIGFRVIPSQTNFLFASPPDGDGQSYFARLRAQSIIVRYFPGAVTGKFVRITVGTPEEMNRLLAATRDFYQK